MIADRYSREGKVPEYMQQQGKWYHLDPEETEIPGEVMKRLLDMWYSNADEVTMKRLCQCDNTNGWTRWHCSTNNGESPSSEIPQDLLAGAAMTRPRLTSEREELRIHTANSGEVEEEKT